MSDVIKDAQEFLTAAVDAEDKNRERFLDDISFSRMSEQWPDEILRVRESEGRPCLTFNRLQPVIRQVVNDSRLNRPQIKAVPVDNGADKDVADIFSGIIRNIEVQSNADIAYDTAVDNAVSGGWGYIALDIDYVDDIGFEQDIRIRRVVDPLAIYGDYNSEAGDSSDWENALEKRMIPKKKYESLYPDAAKTDFTGADWRSLDSNWFGTDDVCVASFWQRERTERKIIGMSDGSIIDLDELNDEAEAYAARGIVPTEQVRSVPSWKVTQTVLSGVEVLDKKAWIGNYIPIIPVYGDEVWKNGQRHLFSMIHSAVDANRMYNYWRSAATEMVALAPRIPFIGKKGQFNDPKWARVNEASYPFVEYEGESPPQRSAGPQVPVGMMQEAMIAADDIKAITGIYDASLGARSNETSGVAINARKVEGDVSTFHFQDNLSRAITHLGKCLVDLIPKIYTTERIIRVLGENDEPEMVQINGEQTDENGAVLKINDLRAGKYDVVVNAGPSFTTRRQEAAEQMLAMVQSQPELLQVMGDLLAKNLDWPGSEEIAERMKKLLPPELQDKDEQGAEGENQLPPEIMQQIEQMQQIIQQGSQQIEQLQADKSEQVAKLDIDREKVEIERYKAETDRLTATSAAMDPQQIQTMVLETIADILSDDIPPQESGSMGPSAEAQPDMTPAF